MSQLKVGIILPMFSGDPAKVLAAARDAEDIGLDGVFAFDHFFPPGAPSDKPALEAFTTLAMVAARTSRVKLGTLVTRAVLRPPGLLAKMASTIDLVSGGRMVIGMGTGDPIDRPEHEAFGFPDLDVKDRRAHLEETVRALKALFEGGVYEGGRWQPRVEGPLVPPPVQEGGPPIWLGAQADQVVRMAGKLADGWNGWGMEPEKFARKVAVLREAAAGRDVTPTWAGIVLLGADEDEATRLLEDRVAKGMADEVAWSGSAEAFAVHLKDLHAAGAEWAILVLAGPAGRRKLLAEKVLPVL